MDKPPRLDSAALLGSYGQLHMRDQGQVYCLGRNSKGELTLTK